MSRRRKILRITRDYLENMLSAVGERLLVFSGIPSDARVVDSWATADGVICLSFESNKFDKTPEGSYYPDLELTIEDETEKYNLLQAMLHDLKEESAAYERGRRDEREDCATMVEEMSLTTDVDEYMTESAQQQIAAAIRARK